MQLPANSHKKALKEWASVCNALSVGRQVLLFRKGGIIERNDQFELETPDFWLYPTFLHQDVTRLQPGEAHFIEAAQSYQVNSEQSKVTLFCRTEKIYQAKNIEALCEHPEWFIWNTKHIQDTWQWKPEKPAYIILVRAYAMQPNQPEIIIKAHTDYSGCVSWVDLHEAIPDVDLRPVIADDVFSSIKTKIEEALFATV